MTPAILIIRDILLLRRGPQDLPYSTQLLTSTIAACVFAHTLSALSLTAADLGTALASAIFFVLLSLLALFALLSLRRLRNRFVQAGTAFLGCHFVFTLMSIPLGLVIPTKSTPPDQIPAFALVLMPVALGCAIWQLVVNAHILRHSLDIPMWTGVAIVLLWTLIALVVVALSGGPALA
jgi:hypothetical protein